MLNNTYFHFVSSLHLINNGIIILINDLSRYLIDYLKLNEILYKRIYFLKFFIEKDGAFLMEILEDYMRLWMLKLSGVLDSNVLHL